MSFESVVKEDSPVVFYRLAEPSGTEAVDASGNSRPATYKNTPTLNEAGGLLTETNASVKFASASTQYAERADENPLDLGDTFSIMAVIKATAWAATWAILSKGVNAYYLRVSATGQLELLKAGVKVIAFGLGGSLMSTGSWYYVLATKTGATMKLYQGKVEAGAKLADVTGTTENATCEDNTKGLCVARNTNNAEYANGWIDEAALFGTALSKERGEAHLSAAIKSAGVAPTLLAMVI